MQTTACNSLEPFCPLSSPHILIRSLRPGIVCGRVQAWWEIIGRLGHWPWPLYPPQRLSKRGVIGCGWVGSGCVAVPLRLVQFLIGSEASQRPDGVCYCPAAFERPCSERTGHDRVRLTTAHGCLSYATDARLHSGQHRMTSNQPQTTSATMAASKILRIKNDKTFFLMVTSSWKSSEESEIPFRKFCAT